MSNQLLVNQDSSGSNMIQKSQIVEGTVILAGSYSNPEPINWASLISGIGYNQSNFQGKGVVGSASSLVTTLAASGGVITATANNNFVAGQLITFFGCTSTLGKLLNGLTFAVSATGLSATQFKISSASTGTGTGETGGCYSGTPFFTAGLNGPTLTASVTSLSLTSSILTVTAANNFLPGAQVTFAGLGTTLGLLLNGLTFTVLSSAGTTFNVYTALTGAAGSDTGTATGRNPASPYNVSFWSANGAGYTYQYSENNANLYILESAGFIPAGTNSAPTITTSSGGVTVVLGVAAGALSEVTGASGITGVQAPVFTGTPVAAAGMAAIGSGALPAGVIADIVKFQAYFLKNQ